MVSICNNFSDAAERGSLTLLCVWPLPHPGIRGYLNFQCSGSVYCAGGRLIDFYYSSPLSLSPWGHFTLVVQSGKHLSWECIAKSLFMIFL